MRNIPIRGSYGSPQTIARQNCIETVKQLMEVSTSNEPQTPQQDNIVESEDHEEIFLPSSLVTLVFKIAKTFKLTSYDEFSLLDTLQFALSKNFEKEMNEKTLNIFIINIVRIVEKYNKSGSQLTNLKLAEVFPQLGITNEEYNDQEFQVFKSIEFKVLTPSSVELIYHFIETHLFDLKKKDFIFEFSLDILRIVYAARTKIYDV